ncbi:MAG: hypothetical protein AAF541_07525 [Pseudomonadota bacterium]
MRELVPTEFPAYGIAQAQHHLFLDQPLAFIESLRKLCKELDG